MKNLFFFLAISFLFIACKDTTLHNSFIYFSEAQPVNVAVINSFPKKFVRTYSLNYSNRLTIEPKCIFRTEIETKTILKSKLDSLPKFELRNNQVFDTSLKKAYKTFIKGDTLTFEIDHIDTLFSFAKNEIAKEYKAALILNKMVENKYQTSIIKFSSLHMHHIQLGTKKDFLKLKAQLKIPYQAHLKEQDTTSVCLSPTRADFRKLLRIDDFEYQSNYLFR
ncbi:MAG TPA: hypothetical protein DDZ41_05430 [Flavobacterium sp.]|nr:hypothetical protein [Flavobacterium sp.]